MSYDYYDLCTLEAAHILRNASDALLGLIGTGHVDIASLARQELRGRRERLATRWIGAMAEQQPL